MNKESFLKELEASPISAEHKQQIREIIEKEGWTVEVIEHVKDIIQADIESDSITFTAEDHASMSGINEDLVRGLDAVEQTLSADMQFVDTEMTDLESSAKELEKGMDGAEIDALRDDIAKSM